MSETTDCSTEEWFIDLSNSEEEASFYALHQIDDEGEVSLHSIDTSLLKCELPAEGEMFEFSYHMFGGVLEFGTIESSGPLSDVMKKNGVITFNDGEGRWLLTEIGGN